MFTKGFPPGQADNLATVWALLPDTVNRLPNANGTCVVGKVSFPYRTYYQPVPEGVVDTLTAEQRLILHCIYSRSHDGYQREAHARALLAHRPLPEWVYPYLLRLADDYVLQVVEAVYKGLMGRSTTALRLFCRDNWQDVTRSYSRMKTYWQLYHRDEYHHLGHYPGELIFVDLFGYEHRQQRYLAACRGRNVGLDGRPRPPIYGFDDAQDALHSLIGMYVVDWKVDFPYNKIQFYLQDREGDGQAHTLQMEGVSGFCSSQYTYSYLASAAHRKFRLKNAAACDGGTPAFVRTTGEPDVNFEPNLYLQLGNGILLARGHTLWVDDSEFGYKRQLKKHTDEWPLHDRQRYRLLLAGEAEAREQAVTDTSAQAPRQDDAQAGREGGMLNRLRSWGRKRDKQRAASGKGGTSPFWWGNLAMLCALCAVFLFGLTGGFDGRGTGVGASLLLGFLLLCALLVAASWVMNLLSLLWRRSDRFFWYSLAMPVAVVLAGALVMAVFKRFM